MPSKPGTQRWEQKAWRYVKLYKCYECEGRAEIHDGVVQVIHALNCSFYVWLAERHPRILQTIGR